MAERIAWVTKIADALEAIQPQIGALESLDTGKPVALATAVDANRSVQNFRFFAKSVTPLQFTTTQPTSPR
jgi:aminomuconate-semialdehyde/2-hydroxymuconate-6-semialdehyde dehydrogenase